MSLKERNFLLFEMGGHEFAVDLSLVEEVIPATNITAMPHSPSFLLGLAAVRGRVMGVIDGADRFRLPASLRKYFLICKVRGNITAIAIDRPYEASSFGVTPLPAEERNDYLRATKIDEKFVTGAFEILQKDKDSTRWKITGRRAFEVNVDLFVSDEMASRVGEV